MATYLQDLLYSFADCLNCFPRSSQLVIKNRSFKIQRLLGEGGFSYVYLVQDTSNSQLLALKKIRCPFGQESVALALKEVEAYSLFAPNPNIIHIIDHSIASDKSDPGAKTVYILLPYYRRGNLQDIINANLVNHTKFPERRLMVLVLGVCRALKAMHQYRVKAKGTDKGLRQAKQVRREAVEADLDAEDAVTSGDHRRRTAMRAQTEAEAHFGDGDVEQTPLMEDEITQSQDGVDPRAIRAYAHRDIKPGNIMIADDGLNPILMDLGSLAPSPTPVTSRSLALAIQDTAAEYCTMPYRAPELFDVKTDTILDTKVDIWSLGCTIYACLVGKSPFEARSEETGGSLTMCVLGGDWRFPDENPLGGKGKTKASDANTNTPEAISEGVKDVVRQCLSVEPTERPDVDQLMRIIRNVIAELPEDHGAQ